MRKALCYLTLTGVLALGGAFTSFAQGAGWSQNENGWRYEKTDGSFSSNEWYSVDGKWYHFDANSIMQTGWVKDGNAWYYLDPANGSMISNTSRTIDGVSYNFNQSGVLTDNSNTSSKNDMSVGHWEGKTFVNDWSEYRITIADSYTTVASEATDGETDSNITDFSVESPSGIGGIEFFYVSDEGDDILTTPQIMQYALQEMNEDNTVLKTTLEQDVTLGRHTYSKGFIYMKEDIVIECYARKTGNYYMFILAGYTPDQADNIHKMIGSIQ
jgi:hypothetical protein